MTCKASSTLADVLGRIGMLDVLDGQRADSVVAGGDKARIGGAYRLPVLLPRDHRRRCTDRLTLERDVLALGHNHLAFGRLDDHRRTTSDLIASVCW